MCLSRIPHGFWRGGRSVNNRATEEGICRQSKNINAGDHEKPERCIVDIFPAAAVCLKKPIAKKSRRRKTEMQTRKNIPCTSRFFQSGEIHTK
jgi:hypothetical protein